MLILIHVYVDYSAGCVLLPEVYMCIQAIVYVCEGGI